MDSGFLIYFQRGTKSDFSLCRISMSKLLHEALAVLSRFGEVLTRNIVLQSVCHGVSLSK